MSVTTSGPRDEDTRAAVLTADGRGAIAVVRLWGPLALQVADVVFRPRRGRSLAQTRPGRLRLGRLGAGLGDEVVAFVTGDRPPEVEVQCHGGLAAVALVLDALRGAGAELVGAEQWTGHRTTARVTAEARADLARAPTLRAAEILLDQAEGALEREVQRIEQSLMLEPQSALAALDGLLGRSRLGLRLVPGFRVVLAGRPNVGKSHLLNALSGYQRSIVAATPGTTRDVVTASTAISGWPVELADTAGLRTATDAIERAGVDRARAYQAAADLVVLVLDRSEPLSDEDRDLLAAYPAALRVASKADLPAAWDPADQVELVVSAVRGDGIADLVTAIGRRLVPAPPPPETALAFRPDQVRALARAHRLLAGRRAAAARRALRPLLAPPPLQPHPSRVKPGQSG